MSVDFTPRSLRGRGGPGHAPAVAMSSGLVWCGEGQGMRDWPAWWLKERMELREPEGLRGAGCRCDSEKETAASPPPASLTCRKGDRSSSRRSGTGPARGNGLETGPGGSRLPGPAASASPAAPRFPSPAGRGETQRGGAKCHEPPRPTPRRSAKANGARQPGDASNCHWSDVLGTRCCLPCDVSNSRATRRSGLKFRGHVAPPASALASARSDRHRGPAVTAASRPGARTESHVLWSGCDVTVSAVRCGRGTPSPPWLCSPHPSPLQLPRQGVPACPPSPTPHPCPHVRARRM